MNFMTIEDRSEQYSPMVPKKETMRRMMTLVQEGNPSFQKESSGSTKTVLENINNIN